MGSNQPPNRLHLNFGFQDRNFSAEQGRNFPTTPSTFPQPMYPNAAGQQEVWGTQQTNNGYSGAPAGYFMNNPYPPQYQQQPRVPTQGAYRAPNAYNDDTNGLVHQFSHQNLGGGGQRTASPYGRQPSPSQRPKTASNIGQQQHGNYLSAPVPAQHTPMVADDELPMRNSDRYPDNVKGRVKFSTAMVSAFFKENVVRAKERNQRAANVDVALREPSLSEARRQQYKLIRQRQEAQFLRFLRTKEKPSNFTTVKIIGKGAFGEVKLVMRKNDGKVYALKSLIKAEMHKKDQLAHVRSERDVLAEADSPWVVKLHTTFQDSTFLYMLMEFLPGGDLMTMLIKYEVFSEDITRFYMAEIILAIEAVHELGFIHRDIKPDNILLDRGGHIKLTDFGLSTGFHKEHEASYYQQLLSKGAPPRNNAANRNSVSIDQIQLTVSNRNQINTWRKSRRQLAFSTVGTPDYIAPEIFSNKGYDYACDWWSVGTIMFECLIGWPPFCAEEPHDTYRKIVDWQRTLHFPEDQQVGHEAEHFIRSLITSAEHRLGSQGGAAEIKTHPFFRGVHWDQLRRIRAPFEPRLTSNIDTGNFPIDEIDQTDTSAALRAQTEARGAPEIEAEMSLPFIGYTYKRFDMFKSS
ncbi:Serine/threonine-protein kinase cot-1 [Cryomyces minteri]|uniref:non-specific serine/threonine protein kinase n=2 Tax=Cryomyces minteri TaxID=331657 RepID=A0A4U0X7L7_9PEZI|nr:Serine/threonine-protein kinase cot-1 [Cryomyces minteri]